MPLEALQKLRQKYPSYNDLSDQELARRILARYPQYQDLLGDIAGQPARVSTPAVATVNRPPAGSLASSPAEFRAAFSRAMGISGEGQPGFGAIPRTLGEAYFGAGVTAPATIGTAAGRYLSARFPGVAKALEPLAQVVRRPAQQVATATAQRAPVVSETAQKLIKALRQAKPIRAEQEALYSAERGRRLGEVLTISEKVPGEAGARQMLTALKGELPKARFEPVRPQFGQAEIDDLYNTIKTSPLLPGYAKIHAITGLGKLLHPEGVGVPQESELKLLARVFGSGFVNAMQRGHNKLPQLIEVAGIPRALASTMDFSAPFRQGLVVGPRYPKQWLRAFGSMFRTALREEAYTALKENIVNRPTFRLMDESGLALSGIDEGILLAREEQFFSRIPERIPILGRLIRGSNRAYTGFLTKLRADVFDELLKRSSTAGVPQTEELTRGIAKFVNTATGRGDLGSFTLASNALSTALFSPRLLASRLNMLNPLYYRSLPSFVRKEALKSFLSLAAAGTTVTSLARLVPGVSVGTDLRSADFGKIKVGNTRVDVWGGFQQYPRIAAQLYSGKVISSTTGKEIRLGEGYRPLTRKDIAFRFFESKANPLVGTILEIMEGRTFEGQKPTLTSTTKRLLTPLISQDLYDLAREDPSLVPLIIPAIFGVGVQTYGPR